MNVRRTALDCIKIIRRKNHVCTAICIQVNKSSGTSNFFFDINSRRGYSTSSQSDDGGRFLDNVNKYAESAHDLALEKLLSVEPEPGKKKKTHYVREKHIRGRVFMFLFTYFYIQSVVKTKSSLRKIYSEKYITIGYIVILGRFF